MAMPSNKRTLLLSIGVAVVVIVIFGMIQLLPKSYMVTLEGVKYQLGADNAASLNPVAIHMDGTLKRSLTGKKTFKGTIDVEGEILPVPEDQRELEISFRRDQAGIITYGYYENGQPRLYAYGVLYVNNDLSKVAIAIFDKDDEGSGGWTGEDGWMITAPAVDRTSALTAANELMKDYLGGNLLK
ncbi:hypothetical protein BK133_23335 [Paenibacillus sp. FSL H8-0548]|uniref:hypothetical protein n=1 Tax=Paenibacillus sp. FSL H8-0548 TaxID=1920422 RepID=UPI00096F8729|nr:hypothetical protein [Paenibacillus sp. FSL H8-0548]OMF24151.1 hypothetical protein BK133_23335 [Paenibacillus sp. FSL H8-0548]